MVFLATLLVVISEQYNHYAVDSRLVEPGSLFFALPGERVDGHAFLESSGAKAAVVSLDYTGPDFGMKLYPVRDVLETLQDMAKKKQARMKCKVIGITGSVGKTTTRNILVTLLKEKYRVATAPKNYNSQIGVPLTILNHVTEDDEILVLEMAMTKKGQIRKLTEIAPLDIALITWIAHAHSENFESLEGIALAKAEILEGAKIGFVPKESPCAELLKGREYFVTSDMPKLPIPGLHNQHNLAGAIAVAKELGLTDEEVEKGVAKIEPVDRRQEHVEKNGILFVNDSYNACAASVIAALKGLPEGKRKIAVLGTMPELGKFSEQCHLEVAEYASKSVDHLLCLGEPTKLMHELWQEMGKDSFWFSKREQLEAALKKMVKPKDVVLLKGGSFLQLWKVLEVF